MYELVPKLVNTDVQELAFTAPEVPSEADELYKRHQEKLESIKAKKANAAKDDPDLAYLLQSVDAYDQWGEREKGAHKERNEECILFSCIIFLIISSFRRHSRAYDEGIFNALLVVEVRAD